MLDIQRILLAIGFKLPKSTAKGPPDGLYGPETSGKWAVAARGRSQDPLFQRLGPTTALVSTRAWNLFRQMAADRGTVVGIYIP